MPRKPWINDARSSGTLWTKDKPYEVFVPGARSGRLSFASEAEAVQAAMEAMTTSGESLPFVQVLHAGTEVQRVLPTIQLQPGTVIPVLDSDTPGTIGRSLGDNVYLATIGDVRCKLAVRWDGPTIDELMVIGEVWP